jgi:predicted methyltransferase
MKSRFSSRIAAVTLFAVLAIPARLAAQENQDNHKHHHYKLIDIGTFGGPNTYSLYPGGGNPKP